MTYRKLFARAEKRHKIVPGACRTKLPTEFLLETRLGALQPGFWTGPGLPWVALVGRFAGFWELWGASWPLLDASWVPLGQLLGALGRFLAGLGRFLNAFLLPGIPRASILEGLGAGRAWFWKASGAYFGMRFAAPRTLKPNAFIHAVTTFFVYRRFAFFPFRCGGLCAAHGSIFARCSPIFVDFRQNFGHHTAAQISATTRRRRFRLSVRPFVRSFVRTDGKPCL